jgi:hypothetical protein
MRLLLLIAVFFASAASAQVRNLPADAKRARMSHVAENIVELDGRRVQLSPGAQIRDPLNRIIMPASLPRASVVKYQRDGAGLVHRVWILSDEEARARR